MLLVSFNCIDPQQNIEDYEEYVRNIFSSLSTDGYIDSIVVDCPDGSTINQDIVQEFDPGFFRTRHVHENRVYSGETYTVTSSSVFEIHYIWGTYKSGLQFSVQIFSDSYKPASSDDYVENLKFAIKTVVKRDWGKIEWLVDKDSECLAVELYPEIFRTENMIRQMISDLMTKYYGTSWWDRFVPYNIKNKYNARQFGYKSVAPGFANIDDHLLSIDIGDLNSILSIKLLKWQPVFDETVNLMINGLTEWKDQKIKDILVKQSIIEVDLWNKHFSEYLPSDFREEMDKYEKNRNHVAHNKMLDRQAYRSIKNNVFEVQRDVSLAIDKIAKLIISEEERELIEEALAFQEEGYEAFIEAEAGVEIRHDDEIQEILDESFEELCLDVEDALRFREDLEFSIKDNKLIVIYKINDKQLEFNSELSIDDEPGATSICEISTDGEFRDVLTYVNGEAKYDEEQASYVPITTEEEPDVDSVASRMVDYINGVFPNLRQIAEASAYRIMKEGGDPPFLSDYPCEECGECCVASDDRFAEKGTCLNCGAKHELYVCSRCGRPIVGEIDEDKPMICAVCTELLEKQ